MLHKNSLSLDFKHKLGFPSNDQVAFPSTLIENMNGYSKSRLTSTNKTMKHVRPTCEENLIQFLLHTTFHGLKFVGNQTISYCERFLFLASFIVAFAVASYFIYDVYIKWDNSPVIVGISPLTLSISSMPFPAITICNVNQVLKSRVDQILKYEPNKTGLVVEICNKEQDIDLIKLSTKNFTSNVTDFEDFMIEASQPCNKMLINCVFGGLKQNCSEIFQPILTDEGKCCTFNNLHPDFYYLHENSFKINSTYYQDGATPVKWTSETGYPAKLPPLFYPRPAVGIGVSNGLSIILDANINEYFCSSTNGGGFKIAIHSPSEIPNTKETGMLIGAGMEARIRIDAKIIESTTAIRSIQQKYRQCVFEEESKLISYAVYSKKNCNMECDINRLYLKCNCIDYYMPRRFKNITSCGMKEIMCVANVLNSKIDLRNPIDREHNECLKRCLPGCYDFNYRGDMFVSPIVVGKFKIKNKFINEMDSSFAHSSITILNFFYTDNSFHPDRKDQFIGMTEFLSYTGGLMGLFLGFSSISIIEIFYYCTFRPFCARIRYNRELRSIEITQVKRQTSQTDLVLNINHDIRAELYDNYKTNKINNKIGYK